MKYIGYSSDLNVVNSTSDQIIYGEKTFDTSPVFPTSVATDDSNLAATTAYVKNQAGDSNPLMNNIATPGIATYFSREDHIHPSDTSRAAASHIHNYAGSSSAGGSASSVASSSILKFDTGTTENTDLYSFNGSSSKTVNIVAGSGIQLTKEANKITFATTSTGTTNLTATHNASTIVVNSDTGTDATINAATTSLAGVMSSTDKTKLDGLNATHTHGDISSTGTLATTSITPGDGDHILLSDGSNSNKIQRGIMIGTDTTIFLRNDGTWASAGTTINNDTFVNYEFLPTFTSATSGTITALRVSSTKLKFNAATGVLSSVSFNATSDEKAKENIVTSKGLDVISKLRGVEFDWKENNKSHSSGVIAQELELILPFLVSEDSEHNKSVNYAGIIAYLIESIKELNVEIKYLKNRI